MHAAYRHSQACSLIPRPNLADHILPHILLLLASDSIDIFRHLPVRVRLSDQLWPSLEVDVRTTLPERGNMGSEM
jgi:hypothetical protein